jgi:hypothetical protein
MLKILEYFQYLVIRHKSYKIYLIGKKYEFHMKEDISFLIFFYFRDRFYDENDRLNKKIFYNLLYVNN